MARTSHPLEMAFLRFDEATKMYFTKIENSFKNVSKIPDVRQPAKRTPKKNIYTDQMTPFGAP